MSADLDKSLLAIDVGSGTQDILVRQPGVAVENSPKMILPSATTIFAGRVSKATSEGHALFLSGKTMGGGPSKTAVLKHLEAGFKVYALKEAALTFHDNLERVKAMGIEIVKQKPDLNPLTELVMGDIDLHAIHRALSLFHVPPPAVTAVAVQDHGFSPGESNRAFRFKQWADLLNSGKGLETLLYQKPPAHLTRMVAITETVPDVWVMDTGAAAIVGSLLDPWAAEKRRDGITLVNIGNEHTVAALVKNRTLWGIYEHHTSLMNPKKLLAHLKKFQRGGLTNQEVFDDMGHGCRVLSGVKNAGPFERLSITGPNRERFSSLGGHMAAPHGDMMLTGCFGLVEAVKRRQT